MTPHVHIAALALGFNCVKSCHIARVGKSTLLLRLFCKLSINLYIHPVSVLACTSRKLGFLGIFLFGTCRMNGLVTYDAVRQGKVAEETGKRNGKTISTDR